MKNKTNEVEISFHSLFVFIIAEKKEKERLSNSFSSFNKQLPFILTHSIPSNQSQSITINHNQATMRMRRGKGENEHHQQPSNKSKPHRLTRAWREGENKLHSPNYPLFQHSISAMNTRSPPMRIDTPQVIRADRDLSHWCFRRQFNRAMSESGVHDNRKYPTRWEMTIHYTANDYSLFKVKQSKSYRRKQSSWNCIACHLSLHPEWAKDLRFAQTGFGVWLWICLLLSAFSLPFLLSLLLPLLLPA